MLRPRRWKVINATSVSLFIAITNIILAFMHLFNCIHYKTFHLDDITQKELDLKEKIFKAHITLFVFFITKAIVDSLLVINCSKIWQFTANNFLFFMYVYPTRYLATYLYLIHYLRTNDHKSYNITINTYFLPKFPPYTTGHEYVIYYAAINIGVFVLIDITQIIFVTIALQRKNNMNDWLNVYNKDDELLQIPFWYRFSYLIFIIFISIGFHFMKNVNIVQRIQHGSEIYVNVYKNKNVTRILKNVSSFANFPIKFMGRISGEEGKRVNAIVAPDGDIYLTDGLIQKMKEKEIASVIAHEIGHIYYGHVKFYIARSYFPLIFFILSIFLLIFSGLEGFGFDKEMPVLPLIFIAINIAETINMYSRYYENVMSRKHEREADCFSVSFNLPMAPSIKILGADQEGRIYSYHMFQAVFRTHPRSAERIDHMMHCPKFITD